MACSDLPLYQNLPCYLVLNLAITCCCIWMRPATVAYRYLLLYLALPADVHECFQ